MTSNTSAEQVDSLLNELDQAEPLSFDLGTPEVMETDPVRRLIDMGPAIVPHLLQRMQEEDAPKKRVAYIVLVLGRIGDVRALGPLVDLCGVYKGRERKEEWDYAVIGECGVAIERLSESSG